MHSLTRLASRSAVVVSAALAIAGCSSAAKKSQEDAAAKDQEISALNGRVQELEGQLKSVNDKLDAMQILFENATHLSKPTTTGVRGHSAENSGKTVATHIAGSDPEAGFERDDAIQAYRRAYVLLQADKTPEALLAFTSFVEKFPDHPLAGAAQYYVGKCYLQQKQYKAAIQEFNRVLTSYDRSSHVSHTLHDLADAEDAIGATESAGKHRQLLNSLFPQSPAAQVASSNGAGSSEAESDSSAVVSRKKGKSAASTAPARSAEPKAKSDEEMPTVSKQAPGSGLDSPPTPPAAAAPTGTSPPATAPALDKSEEKPE